MLYISGPEYGTPRLEVSISTLFIMNARIEMQGGHLITRLSLPRGTCPGRSAPHR